LGLGVVRPKKASAVVSNPNSNLAHWARKEVQKDSILDGGWATERTIWKKRGWTKKGALVFLVGGGDGFGRISNGNVRIAEKYLMRVKENRNRKE